MEPGTILYTKDGSKMGNAIIRRVVPNNEIKDFAPSLLGYLAQTNQYLYEIVTDFGNVTRLSTNEINEMYLVGPQQNFLEWHCARWEKILDLNELVYGHDRRVNPAPITRVKG